MKLDHVVVIAADGTCTDCGKRAKYDAAFGKVVHVRGRVKGSSPWKRDMVQPKAESPARSLMPVRSSEPPRSRRLTCPDCGAQLQELASGTLRCPWTRDRRQVFLDGIVACGWPRGEKPPRAVA